MKTKRKIAGKIFLILFSLLAGAGAYYFYRNLIISAAFFFGVIIAISLYLYFSKSLKSSARIRKMEEAFPDFLQLMSSNLRAGMTISKAMLLSSREEFAPLDKEILRVGKDVTTGKDIERALLDMSDRIGSEKIHKTLLLIISGIKAGGNLAILLEETATNMGEREFVEKRASSNVLMYVIFIFIAVAVAAPALFALSNILVGVLANLLKGLPTMQTSINVPFTLSSITISTDFIMYFSIAFILMLDIMAALVLGLVSKGEERDGLKYVIPILILSIGIFFLIKIALSGFLAGLF